MSSEQRAAFIEHLPDELLLNVFPYFKVLRKFSSPSYACYDIHKSPDELRRMRENRSHINDLNALCLVSKRCLRICQPLLFSAFVADGYVTFGDTAGLFLRTILRKPELQSCIQYVENNIHEVQVAIRQQNAIQHGSARPSRRFMKVPLMPGRPKVREVPKRRLGTEYLQMVKETTSQMQHHPRCTEEAWENLFKTNPNKAELAMIIALARNLEHLYLARYEPKTGSIPDSICNYIGFSLVVEKMEPRYPRLRTLFLEDDQTYGLRSSPHNMIPYSQIMPQLKSLGILGALSRYHFTDITARKVLELDTIQLSRNEIYFEDLHAVITSFPALKSMYVDFGSSALPPYRSDVPGTMQFQKTINIERLSLHHVTVPMEHLRPIINACKSLKIFACETLKLGAQSPIEFHFPTLWNALLQHQHSLEHLHLNIHPRNWQLDVKPVLSISELRNFTSLKVLTIRPEHLVGTADEYSTTAIREFWRTEKPTWLSQILPPSLQKLTIVRGWDFRDDAAPLLYALAEDRAALPQLNQVVLESGWSYPNLTKAFKKHGVRFTVTELETQPPTL